MQRATALVDEVEKDRFADRAMDRLLIRELLENWVLWRDAGEWERFATVWHDDGKMVATWFQASAPEFIAGCRKGFEAGTVALHMLGGSTVDVLGNRAVSYSKMQIMQRGIADGVEVDVTCFGRFVDAWERREQRWGLVRRQLIYELDRLTPAQPGQVPLLDEGLLNQFPQGYRHLAYLQTQAGFTVDKHLPGTRGAEVDALNARMKAWLKGEPVDWPS